MSDKKVIHNHYNVVNYNKNKKFPSGKLVLTLLSAIFLLSLLANLFSVVRGGTNHYSFRYFLETLQSFDTLSFDLNRLNSNKYYH